MKKGKYISMHHRDQVRPFARRLGDLLERFEGEVFDLELPELEQLRTAVAATLAATSGHGSGKFYHAAKFLEPTIRAAIEEALCPAPPEDGIMNREAS